jgi:hypothetical protein
MKVRPLAGGIDAWSRGGRKLDRKKPLLRLLSSRQDRLPTSHNLDRPGLASRKLGSMLGACISSTVSSVPWRWRPKYWRNAGR